MSGIPRTINRHSPEIPSPLIPLHTKGNPVRHPICSAASKLSETQIAQNRIMNTGESGEISHIPSWGAIWNPNKRTNERPHVPCSKDAILPA